MMIKEYKNFINRSMISQYQCLKILSVLFFMLNLSSCLSQNETEALNQAQDIKSIHSFDFTEDTHAIELADSVQEFIDPQGVLTLQEVIQKNQFHSIEKGRVRNYQASDSYWYRFGIKNPSDKSRDLYLKTKNRNIVAAGLYQLDAKYLKAYQSNVDLIDSVEVEYQPFGDAYPFQERSVRSRKYVVRFEVPAHAEHYFYLKWQDKGQAIFEMEVVDRDQFFSEQMLSQGYLFLIIGFALGVLIYNLTIFWRTREQLYLSYSIYIVCFLFFLENQNGSIAFIWPRSFDTDLTSLSVWASAFLVMFSACRFTSQILQLQERDSERAYWFKIVQILSLLFAAACFYIPYQAIEYATYIVSLTVVVLCVGSAFQIVKRYNDQAAKIYLYSFLPIAVCILLVMAIYALELVAFPFMDELLRIAFGLNLVILSTALANHIDAMQEKQRAYEAMLVAAKASEHAKSEFFGKMSHEIRTPLNGVIGMTQLLEGTHVDEMQKKYIDILKASSSALMHLVNNIVDFSQVDAGKMKVDEREFNLQEMLLDIEKVFMMRVLESRVPLIFEIEDWLPKNYFGDMNRIRQILINLLGNAYKFTSKGIIKVKVSSLKDDPRWLNKNALRFEVIDTGIGIPAEQVESIFEDFTQVYSAGERKYGGAGLGLAICRELSTLLKGEIKLHSHLGSGSTFQLDIPLELVKKDDLNKKDIFFVIEKNKTLSSRSVLLIDDCTACREILTDISTRWGMKTGAVSTLEAGLANARRSSDVSVPIDLVIVDYNCLIEQEGGNHFINALSRHGATKNAIILILVSQASIAAQFSFLVNKKVFIIQRKALVRQLEDAFVAAINGDENYFKNNRPLLKENLDELLEINLGSQRA